VIKIASLRWHDWGVNSRFDPNIERDRAGRRLARVLLITFRNVHEIDEATIAIG
jgi:hypothetical protein